MVYKKQVICPFCGSVVEYNSNDEVAVCEFCNKTIILNNEKDILSKNNSTDSEIIVNKSNNNEKDYKINEKKPSSLEILKIVSALNTINKEKNNRLEPIKKDENPIVDPLLSDDYKTLCKKMLSEAEISDKCYKTEINKIVDVLLKRFPNSYFSCLYNFYYKYNLRNIIDFGMLLKPQKYWDFKNDLFLSSTTDKYFYPLMWINLKRDNYFNTDFKNTKSIYSNGSSLSRGFITSEINDIKNNCHKTIVDRSIYFFDCFERFIDDFEEHILSTSFLKYEFEHLNFDELKRIRDDSKSKAYWYKDYKKKTEEYFQENKMQCGQYLDCIESNHECFNLEKPKFRDYYTFGGYPTGIYCQTIGLILLIVGIISFIFLVNYYVRTYDISSYFEMYCTYFILLLIPAYVVLFIGFLRYDDFSHKRRWPFIFLPPALIVMSIIYLIRNLIDINDETYTYRSEKKKYKKAKKAHKKKVEEMKSIVSSYRNSVVFANVREMFKNFNYDFDILR